MCSVTYTPEGAAPIAKYHPLLDSCYNTGSCQTLALPMNTPIITHTGRTVNAQAKIQRPLYTIEQGGRDVCKSAFKLEHGLTPRSVANGPLFNNPTLSYVAPDYAPSEATVGLLFRGAERRYDGVPYVWQTDCRGNRRRMILQKDFRALPQLLQEVAKTNGVNVDGSYVCFSRCLRAWAGAVLHKGLHVHHVNMDTTDDRLGNLQVLTASEHQAMHHDTKSLVWDADWYEYTSTDGGMLRVSMALTIEGDDIAPPLEEDDGFDAWYDEARKGAPSLEEVLASMGALLAAAGIRQTPT